MAIKHVLTIQLFYAQARRIDCAHCSKPYSWIEGGVQTGRTEAGVAFSDENEMRREAFRKAADPLVEVAGREQVGRARCPHCHQLQPWMFVSKGTAVIGSLVAAVVAAGVLGFIAYQLGSATTAVYTGGGVAGVGILLALVFGARLADKPGPQPDEKDDGVKTDAQLLELIQRSGDSRRDPFVSWWRSTGHEPPAKAAAVSLGFLDRSKSPLTVDEALTTAACTRELAAMDG
jgi:hypothetical protein